MDVHSIYYDYHFTVYVPKTIIHSNVCQLSLKNKKKCKWMLLFIILIK